MFRTQQLSILDKRRASSANATILAPKFKLRHYPGFWWSWAGTGQSLTAPSVDPDNARDAKRLLLLAEVVERAGCAKLAYLIETETRDGRRNTIPGVRIYDAPEPAHIEFHDGEVVILLPGVEEPYRCPADQAQNVLLERVPPRQDMIRVRAMREK